MALKVFLSSTAQDLVAYRKVAEDTILRLSQEALVMERFGPLPREPAAECERKAAESDVVLCVVAHRYGVVPEKGLGSITRREVEAAKRAGKDVLVWIVEDDHPWTEKKEQDLLTDPSVLAAPERVAEVAAGVAALVEFKTWLRTTFVCDTFTTPDALGRKIAVALAKYAPAGGGHSAAMARKQGEVRVIHALQPAPHFHGRDGLVSELSSWVADLASPDRVWSLVAAGGTGKTAVIERVIQDVCAGEASVLVWSFYEKPDADAFLRECNQLFLGEGEGPAGGRLERLQRGLRDGRPHLIVLDGLERVQEDAGGGRVRGELSDQTLKLLLRAVTAGLGRVRALVTSRFSLVDLQDWNLRGYRETRLDDLSPEAAVAVLRGWGVVGDEAKLRAAALQVGHHALSVAVIGSYLRFFANGAIDEVARFDLDAVTGDDAKAAKLARVLAFYAERLPVEERELLARLAVFPRGVSLELLGIVLAAGGEVAGLLLHARPRLVGLLGSLKARGLVFEYRSDTALTWTAHPFLRERFRELLGCAPERVFEVVARELGAGLDARPETKPSDPDVLDRYERLIEATRLAGRAKEAFDLFCDGFGGYQHVGIVLGEYQRGYRMLAPFSASGSPEDLAPALGLRDRSLLATALALFALGLGRLAESISIRYVDDSWGSALAEPELVATGLLNSSELAFLRGALAESRSLASAGRAALPASPDSRLTQHLDLAHAAAAHALGDVLVASAAFLALRAHLVSLGDARHVLDLGELSTARVVGENLASINELPRLLFRGHALVARVDLAEGKDPTAHLDAVRAWTSRTGDMELIIEAHLLTARQLLAMGDPQAALGEAESGLLHAVACGYQLLRIELLIATARIRLGWPDPPRAIQAAREALDLATHADCRYAWGEADAAQAWGEAYFANHEPALAARAFSQALAVRKRIQHPGAAETELWLGRVG